MTMRDTYTKVLLAIIALGLSASARGRRSRLGRSTTTSPAAAATGSAVDGPFNEHLVRDVGTLNLALAAVAIAALVRPGRYLVQVVAAATLINAAPHFLYHLFHLDRAATRATRWRRS